MFRPVPMDRIEILLLQRDLEPATRRLAEEGVLHLRTMEVGEEKTSPADAGEVPEHLEKLRGLEHRLRSVMDALGIAASASGETVAVRPDYWREVVGALETRLDSLEKRIEEVRRRQCLAQDLQTLVGALSGLDADYAAMIDLRKTVLRFGRIGREDLEALRDEIEPLKAFALQEEREGVLVVLLTAGCCEAALDKALGACGYEDISLPRLSGSLPVTERRLRSLRGRCELHLRNLRSRRLAMQEHNRVRLQTWLRSLRAEILLLVSRGQFGYTERSVVLGGWIPRERADDVERALMETCGLRHTLIRNPAQEEDTPVQVFNPKLLRPFQKMLAVYGTPGYRELEPTPLLAAGFILLFGMMFGDLGHGLVFLAFGWSLRRYTNRWTEEGLIFMEIGACAALFGLLFGSVFGNEEILPPILFSPMHHIPMLMVLAISVGVALIVTGLGLKIRNDWKEGRKAAVLTDRNGVAGLVFYLGTIATGLLVWGGALPGAAALWLVLPLIGVFLHSFVATQEKQPVGMNIAEGIVEVMETVLGYLANTFSFLRVAAFGLAHVGLARAVFALAEHVGGLPGGDIWVVLVHVAGNAIILVLEGLVVSIQAVRLEFYEFFSKFFRGDGVAYRPLALDSGYERGG